ncbi:hypothetical protein J7K60_04530 [Candidatus Bipolaricaulota bacterium]|nr:hypothetical protein [Candidatus Bipolaricaulota bacterium]
MMRLTVDTIDQVIEVIISKESVRLDLTGVGFIDPYSLLLLVLCLRYRQMFGSPLAVRWPVRKDALGWMRAMGFFAEIDDPKRTWRSEASSRSDALQPITHITREDSVSRLVNAFDKRLHERYPLTDEARNALVKIMFELFQNIPQHSNATGEVSDPYGLAAMQDYTDSIFLAVADMGIGLARSLSTRKDLMDLSDGSALNRIVYDGLSRFSDPGRGGELRRIAQLVRRWDGLLIIRSGEALLYMDAERGDIYDAPYFPGVQIGLRLSRRVFGIDSPMVDNGAFL